MSWFAHVFWLLVVVQTQTSPKNGGGLVVKMTRRVRFPDSISGPMFEVVHVCTNTQSCKVIWNPCVIFLNNTICINVHPPGLFIPSLCLVNPYMFHDAIKCYYTILYSDYLRPVSVFLCGDTWWYLVPPCLWPGRASSSLSGSGPCTWDLESLIPQEEPLTSFFSSQIGNSPAERGRKDVEVWLVVLALACFFVIHGSWAWIRTRALAVLGHRLWFAEGIFGMHCKMAAPAIHCEGNELYLFAYNCHKPLCRQSNLARHVGDSAWYFWGMAEIWRFSKIGLRLVFIHVRLGSSSSYTGEPFWESPMAVETSGISSHRCPFPIGWWVEGFVLALSQQLTDERWGTTTPAQTSFYPMDFIGCVMRI